MAILTLDIGTSELKATIFSSTGQSLSATKAEMPLAIVEQKRAELDPEVLWGAVSTAVRGLDAKARNEVSTAALSTQGETFVAVDRWGAALGNLILNVDSRASVEIDGFVAAFGATRLHDKTGLPPHPTYTLPKIAWLSRHEPDLFSRTSKFLPLESYLLHRLGFDPVISWSLASRTLGFDLRAKCWDSELLEFTGIREDRLPDLTEPGKQVGVLNCDIARELGLPDDLIWCIAGHDQACASLGAGALDHGALADGTGTFECASIPLNALPLSLSPGQPNLPYECHVVPGYFLVLAYVPGGVALKWLRDIFQNPPDRSYSALVAGLPLDPTGIFCFPYFLGTGTPWLKSEAKAAICGLTSQTTQKMLVQAMLEGVCFEMRRNLEHLNQWEIALDRVFAVGGGAQSGAWLQLKSDIFGCPVIHLPGEASSRGAAICAAVAAGEFSNWREAASQMNKRGLAYEPRSAATARYRTLFEEYKQTAAKLYDFTQ